jgi:hypothetical protein
MPDLVTITDEPAGAVYVALLEFARSTDSLFSLTWRERGHYDPSARAVASQLEPDLAVQLRTDNWPGTQLGGYATVCLYRISEESLGVLSSVRRLYAWDMPALPEDLAFYTADREPWLGSTAHESDSFLYADNIDVSAVASAVGLKPQR